MRFCELRPRIDNAMGDIDNAVSRYGAAKTQLTQVQSGLTGMIAVYGDVITEVDAGALANPDDAAWQSLQAEKDIAVSERAGVLNEVEAALLVFEKIESHGAAEVLAKLNELA